MYIYNTTCTRFIILWFKHGIRDLSTQDNDEYNNRNLHIHINGQNHEGLSGEDDSNAAAANRHIYQQDDNSASTFPTFEM